MNPSLTPTVSVIDAEVAVIGVLALMFAGVARRTRGRGMATLAWGFALAALWYAASEHIAYAGPDIDTLPQHLGAMVIGAAVVLISTGVVLHLGWPAGWMRAVVLACSAPALVLIAALAIGIDLPHGVFHTGVMLSYGGAALVAFAGAAAHPRSGRVALGCAILVLALLPPAMSALGIDPLQLKYLAGVALAAFGVFLLAATLLHREHALEAEIGLRRVAETGLRDANLRLEARVAERTAHLHELIGGLEDFARGVSHDLRGPLGGMAQLAQHAAQAIEHGDLALARSALPAIARQCEASSRMVVSMLELARLGEANARQAPLELETVVRQAWGQVLLARPGQAMPVLRCGALPALRADPELLQQVLVNLLGNAAKFSAGRADAEVVVDARAEGRDLLVRVRDNGIGFPAEAAPRLFEPLFRAHGAHFEGHGLGLSIVRRAVQAMGGTVWAEPGEGGGAVFAILLREAAVAAEPVAAEVQKAPASIL